MNKIKNRIIQKILIVLTMVTLLFNFMFPVKSQAAVWDWLGGLWDDVLGLVCGLGDVVFSFLQPTFIEGAPKAIVKLTQSEIDNGQKYGWIQGKLEGVLSGKGSDYFSKNIVFPSIYYSVENIFANKIPAFDVNFINPSVKAPKVDENGRNMIQQTEVKVFLQNNDSYQGLKDLPETSNYNKIIKSFEEIIKNGVNMSDQKQRSWLQEAQNKIASAKKGTAPSNRLCSQ